MPFTAELGGKGPFIVFADADLDAAAEKAAVMFDDGGQVCLAGTRLLVEASIRDDFVERFEVATQRHVLGDSREADDHDLAVDPPRAPRARRRFRPASDVRTATRSSSGARS